MSEMHRHFARAHRSFSAAQEELADIMSTLFAELDMLEKMVSEAEAPGGEGATVEEISRRRIFITRLGAKVGQAHHSAGPMPFFWTPPPDAAGWRPIVKTGGEGIGTADKQLRALIAKTRQIDPNDDVLQETRTRLKRAKQHFDEAAQAIGEMTRVLDTGGSCAITDDPSQQTKPLQPKPPSTATGGLMGAIWRWRRRRRRPPEPPK